MLSVLQYLANVFFIEKLSTELEILHLHIFWSIVYRYGLLILSHLFLYQEKIFSFTTLYSSGKVEVIGYSVVLLMMSVEGFSHLPPSWRECSAF